MSSWVGDESFFAWAKSHGLKVVTSYKDYEIRSIELGYGKNTFFRIWIEPQDACGRIMIKVSDNNRIHRKRRHQSFISNAETLVEQLDAAHALAKRWIEDDKVAP